MYSVFMKSMSPSPREEDPPCDPDSVPTYEFFREWEPVKDFLEKTARLYKSLLHRKPFDERTFLASSVQLLSCTNYEAEHLLQGCKLLMEKFDFVGITVKFCRLLATFTELQWHFLGAVQNFTEASEEYAAALAKQGLLSVLMENIMTVPGQPQGKDCSVDVLKDFVMCSLATIMNIVRRPGNALYFTDSRWKEALDGFQLGRLSECPSRDQDTLNLCRIIILAYVLPKEEHSLLEKHSHIITTLLNMIKAAKKDFTRSRKHLGFGIPELLNAMAVMTVSGKISKLLLETPDGVEELKLLCSVSYPDEFFCATKVLLNLAFERSSRPILLEKFGMASFLENLKTLDVSEEIKKNVESILWLLQEKMTQSPENKDENKKSGSNQQQPLIFISYCSDKKQLVWPLKEKLRQEGFECWLDVEQMQGSTLEAMAEGIDISQVVLMCMSESYKLSANCRMEAEYAVVRQKQIIPLIVEEKYKPTGWLGLILGAKLYYDFSGRRDMNATFGKLCSVLRHEEVAKEPLSNGRGGKERNDNGEGDRQSKSHRQNELSWLQSVRSWNYSQVIDWLVTHDLSRIKGAFREMEMDGGMLAELFRISLESPDHFYRCLADDLHMTLRDRLKFMQAMRTLIEKTS